MLLTFETSTLPDHPSKEGDRIRIDAGPSPAGSHEVGTFLGCERFWAFLKYTDLRGVYEPYIRGGMIHTALAHDYARHALTHQRTPIQCGDVLVSRADDLYTPIEAMRLAALAYPTQKERECAASVWLHCEKTIQKYLEHADSTRPRTRILAVETLIEATLPGGQRHTARIDFDEEGSGGVWLGDHKSTEQPVAKARALYAASLQLSALHHFGRLRYGDRFKGVILHLLRMGSGLTERIPYNAPYLTQDTPRLLASTRARMAATQAQNGTDVYAYLPTGLGGGCKDGTRPCIALSRCAFRTDS